MAEAASANHKLTNLHRQVLDEIDGLLALARNQDPAVDAVTPVSGWSVLDHVEHLALADEASLHQLEAALERDSGPPIRLAGRAVLLTGWIPRGVGKAPEPSRPASSGREAVVTRFEAVRHRVEELSGKLGQIGSGRGRASHPVFGGLSAAQWLRFLTIHHHHHRKIIDAIRRAVDAEQAS